MSDVKMNCAFDFSLVIERMIREHKTSVPLNVLSKLEDFAQICFEEGVRVGKLPVNRPII